MNHVELKKKNELSQLEVVESCKIHGHFSRSICAQYYLENDCWSPTSSASTSTSYMSYVLNFMDKFFIC